MCFLDTNEMAPHWTVYTAGIREPSCSI